VPKRNNRNAASAGCRYAVVIATLGRAESIRLAMKISGPFGRDRNTLTANSLLNKVADGSLALVKLAREFGADVAAEELARAFTAEDEIIVGQDFAERLEDLGQLAANALAAILKVKNSVYGETRAETTEVNLGALDGQAVNIVVHGHVAPQVIRGLAEAAKQSSISVKLSAVCGADAGGTVTLPVLTNYDSQETILLTGVVDLLVVGNQCVMPAMISFAQKENVPVVRSSSLHNKAALDTALQTAKDAFHRRAGKTTAIPPVTRPLYTSCGTADGKFNEALKTGFARGSVKGLVYLGGCGSIDHSQDAMPVRLAKQLLEGGYVVVTSGCSGTSLAKAGMTDPDFANGNPVLKAALPDGQPTVLYIGSCHDAARFLAMAEGLKECGMPVFAVLPEVTHHKTLATAAAFAASGITAFVGLEQIFADAAVKDLLGSATTGRSRILPLGDLENAPRAWAEAAAGR
jgi:hydroxylamine reductase (hybrid-cluster protein)